MAQTGFTPIQLYYSTTAGVSPAPTDLLFGELALNIADGRLFYKDPSNIVQQISGGSSSGVTSLSFNDLGFTPNTSTTGNITVAGTLNAAHGGTGQTTFTAGDILYASGATTLTKLPVGTNGQVLSVTGGVPAWANAAGSGTVTSVDISGGTTGLTATGGPITAAGTITLGGTLNVANGGTGAATLSGVLFGNGTSAISAATGTQIATALGSSPVGVATNVAGGTARQIAVQTAPSATSFVVAPTAANTFLQWNGTDFEWSSSVASGVTSFKTTLDGLTPTVADTGDVILAGTLGVDGGGTGVTTISGLVYGNNKAPFTQATGAQVVSTIGTNAVARATNLANGANHQIVYQTGANATGFIPAPTTASTVLSWNGTDFAWASGGGGGGGTTTFPLTLEDDGTGAAAGTTFNGSTGVVISYNSIGAPKFDGTNASGTWPISISGTATQVSGSVTFNNTGTGAASGATFDGSPAITVSYNTLGAAALSGVNATGTWPISVTGNAATTSQTSFSNLTIGASQVLSAANYNGYAPKLDGTGATGTWPIAISGNAASATTIAGTVAVGNGGTGRTSFTANSLVIGNGTGNLGTLVGTAAGQVATWDGTTWVAAAGGGGGAVTKIIGSNLGISPTTGVGDVTISLTSTGITTALGFTPYNNTNPSGFITSSGSCAYATSSGSATSAASAAKWTTARTFTLSGAVTGSASVDGSSNVTITTTLGSTAIPIASGGTGSTTAAAALTALGAAKLAGGNAFSGGTQACAVSNFDVPAWSCSGGGKSGAVSPTTLQLRETGVGVLAYAAGTIGLAPVTSGGTGGLTINSTSVQLGGTSVTLTTPGSNAYKPGGGAWADSSDIRLKTNVQTLNDCLNTVLALNPVEFNWVQGYRNGAPEVGFIADEVEQVIPSAVTEYVPQEDPYHQSGNLEVQELKNLLGEGVAVKTVGWRNDFFAYLVGAIKELKAEVDALKAQLPPQ